MCCSTYGQIKQQKIAELRKALRNWQECGSTIGRIGKGRRTPRVGSAHGSWPALDCTGGRRMRCHSHSAPKHSSATLEDLMGSRDATWSWRCTNYPHCSGSPGGRIKVPKTFPLQSVCVQRDHRARSLEVLGNINPCEGAFKCPVWTVSCK